MKICAKCGKELFDEAIFCPGCGCIATNDGKVIGAVVPTEASAVAPEAAPSNKKSNAPRSKKIFILCGVGFGLMLLASVAILIISLIGWGAILASAICNIVALVMAIKDHKRFKGDPLVKKALTTAIISISVSTVIAFAAIAVYTVLCVVGFLIGIVFAYAVFIVVIVAATALEMVGIFAPFLPLLIPLIGLLTPLFGGGMAPVPEGSSVSLPELLEGSQSILELLQNVAGIIEILEYIFNILMIFI